MALLDGQLFLSRALEPAKEEPTSRNWWWTEKARRVELKEFPLGSIVYFSRGGATSSASGIQSLGFQFNLVQLNFNLIQSNSARGRWIVTFPLE